MRCSRCGTELPADARFCPSCGASVAGLPAAEERKFVSVLFVDVVGSTAHADGADPEDVRDRNQLYYREARDRIERHGGTIEKYVGDAVMAVFGAPLARSDDAERAVRAALSILEGIAALNERDPGLDLQVRAAVCTGEAIVSVDAAPADALATGDVVNTAARLQSAAPTDRVVVGAETYRLTRHAFDYRELEAVDAKGKRDPVPAWLVERSLVAPAERPTSTTPLVGRDREVLLIRTVWDRAVTAGSPHLVTVVGPAGIGKSRLAEEVAAEIEGRGERSLWGRSLPYEEQTPYRAFGQIVRRAAGIYENDGVDVARQKLGTLVGSRLPRRRGGRCHALPLVDARTGGRRGGVGTDPPAVRGAPDRGAPLGAGPAAAGVRGRALGGRLAARPDRLPDRARPRSSGRVPRARPAGVPGDRVPRGAPA